jgi:hypothetical protein
MTNLGYTLANQLVRLSRLLLLLALGSSLACQAESPPRGPEETCTKACAGRAKQCSAHECARGCNLVLDRLAEHVGETVVRCVGGAAGSVDRWGPGPTGCDDRRWARCAALVGPHADGGPPPPPPPSDDIPEE